ncbi:suppressor of fused domain protein [Bacillus sp. DX1.1]|uniref:suppressor of fused domain protein n=1 Tax=unclassified Bacillus (in: firmicutes) TaxID=185979 RepID=UPI002570AB6D|nr:MULTISPECIES: suppressor of fused domain protein [unclassified Bacillus (in: firmicutes)]MDM5154723.1 suppressor of fused domain protein [Bacillus sp. DX1.1]WJE83609.1 suppressor of fused domain protein [Bacillus sp. DX3.1]
MENIQLAKEIRTAIKQNNVERVVELIGSDMELLNMTMRPFGTFLHVAATHGKLEIVKRLIDLGADINRRGGIYGGESLNQVASKGQIEIVRYLLSCGAEMDVSEPERNPLFGAIQGGYVDIAKLLIENGIDIHVKYTGEYMKNMDALAFAHEQGQIEIANLLDSDKKEEYKDTTQNGKTEILDYITEQFGPINNTISEIIPGSKVAVDIQVILPSKEHDFITLVTTGMSDLAMDDSEDSKGFKYAELVLKLPANWPISKNEMTNKDNYWPLKWLRMVAHIPHKCDGWLDEGVILPNGEPPMPFASNTALSCILISKSKEMRSFIDSENRIINFYTLIPIYTEERMIALQKGHEYLIERFDKFGISDVLGIKRENIGLKG